MEKLQFLGLMASGQRRQWKSPEEQIAWLQERVDSMQELYTQETRARIEEIKTLHAANGRHKRALLSNQRKFHARDELIAKLEKRLAEICHRGSDYPTGSKA